MGWASGFFRGEGGQFLAKIRTQSQSKFPRIIFIKLTEKFSNPKFFKKKNCMINLDNFFSIMILCIIILVRILRDRFHLEMGYLETSDWDIWYNLLTYNRRNIFSLQFLHKSAGNLEKSLFFFGFEVLSYIPLRRPYLAEILPIWRRTPSNQSINQSINQSHCFFGHSIDRTLLPGSLLLFFKE